MKGTHDVHRADLDMGVLSCESHSLLKRRLRAVRELETAGHAGRWGPSLETGTDLGNCVDV